MISLLARIQNGPIVVADGATGSLLIEHGLEPGAAPESLNLTRSNVLHSVATDYIDAGAEIVHTNTFGASPLKLAGHGLEEQTEEINRAAVLAARTAVETVEAARGDVANPGSRAAEGDAEVTTARPRAVYISGSVGPTGRTLIPYGDTEPDEVREGFERQIGALVAAGVGAVTIETMIDLAEAKLAVQAARTVSSSIPIMATLTFDVLPRGIYTIMGNDVATAVEVLLDAGANVVGSNCGNGTESMLAIAREFRNVTDTPLLFQPNAGVPRIENGVTVFSETPEDMAAYASAFADLGVAVLGGCCGTTPAHIRTLSNTLRGYTRNSSASP
ncbi:homocysteine S-methyltransferase family protein [bacterium]|nr:homocysteine S-methyltransferase family protein [bacterium]